MEASAQGGAVVIAAIDGEAGAGKSALAVHWAHRHAELFPDAHLYIDLRGFAPSGSPITTAAAMRRLLTALAVAPELIPSDPDAQADLFRSVLAGKRAVLVLDNALDTDQVRPLLPGMAGCLVLVTSRSRLTDLVAVHGAIPVTVGPMTQHEARELLARRLGLARIAREPQAVDELIALCGRLPLALNLAAARATVHPDTTLSTLTEELHDAGQRVDTLSMVPSPAEVRAPFAWSYSTLSAQGAELLRLLADITPTSPNTAYDVRSGPPDSPTVRTPTTSPSPVPSPVPSLSAAPLR